MTDESTSPPSDTSPDDQRRIPHEHPIRHEQIVMPPTIYHAPHINRVQIHGVQNFGSGTPESNGISFGSSGPVHFSAPPIHGFGGLPPNNPGQQGKTEHSSQEHPLLSDHVHKIAQAFGVADNQIDILPDKDGKPAQIAITYTKDDKNRVPAQFLENNLTNTDVSPDQSMFTIYSRQLMNLNEQGQFVSLKEDMLERIAHARKQGNEASAQPEQASTQMPHSESLGAKSLTGNETASAAKTAKGPSRDELYKALQAYNVELGKRNMPTLSGGDAKEEKDATDQIKTILDKNMMPGNEAGAAEELKRIQSATKILHDNDLTNPAHAAQVNAANGHLFELAAGNTKVDKDHDGGYAAQEAKLRHMEKMSPAELAKICAKIQSDPRHQQHSYDIVKLGNVDVSSVGATKGGTDQGKAH